MYENSQAHLRDCGRFDGRRVITLDFPRSRGRRPAAVSRVEPCWPDGSRFEWLRLGAPLATGPNRTSEPLAAHVGLAKFLLQGVLVAMGVPASQPITPRPVAF
jgi:hypothetical protein